MTEQFMRHFISVIATVVSLLTFFAGYKAGQAGWWWMVFSVIVIYFIIYKLLEV